MKALKKIDENTNVITWFEIPVINTERAKTFYETILDIKMITRSIPETQEELTFFPYNPDVVQATSGRITGVLSKSENNQPSDKGTLVYINAYPEIQVVLDKVESAGGRIVSPAMKMNAGYIAVIRDTEGNRIGLHAEK
ncbi:VOC family protein [Chryseobacterium sp. PTM-20240506]|uniref:VOC family protein n=1 Tax=unclassified Chryseobacterium TaxID=2593645 RepID=UPI001557A4FD|nr:MULTISPECIES: VOC family protein [unclassified Chryseobacterium]MDC8104942.1 VOC family protein [Chryseobacterium sp. B21-037]MDQ1805273.1 VOC family protein [Chryseobacterium sp. CKR4-1]WBV58431.1 VOC family protein [Chryseobacterium daecheongense]